jgi:hypothetical protein
MGGFLQDGNNNNSSLRLVFIVYMIATVTLLVIIIALMIRSSLTGIGNSEDLKEIIKWITGGTLGGYLAKVAQKKIEETPVAVKPKFPQPPPVSGVDGIVIDRIFEDDKKTLSECGVWVKDKFVFYFKGLELPWKNNEVGVSRIPSGEFDAIAAKRPNGKFSIRFLEVVGRTWILIHIANYIREIRGCIAPGLKFADIDGDGLIDVSDSKKVMTALEKHFPLGTGLKIWVRDRFNET